MLGQTEKIANVKESGRRAGRARARLSPFAPTAFLLHSSFMFVLISLFSSSPFHSQPIITPAKQASFFNSLTLFIINSKLKATYKKMCTSTR